MKKFIKSLLFIAVFVMAVLPAFSAEDSVYQTVKSALDKFDHRVPGSPEYYRSIDSLEKILTDNGISVHRQVYQTYVPKDTKLVFRINGKDVKIRALSPNNLSLITTGEKEINADLIYLPPSQLYESYGNVGGKIAVLEWGENYYPKTLFTENAKAVIFVGNDKATQWDV